MRQTRIMNKCTVRFLRNRTTSDEDDVLRVFEDTDFEEMLRVTFHPAGQKRMAEFYLSREGVLNYISTILKTMSYDTAPFHEVQVDTVLHPSILYHTSDLSTREVRNMVVDTIDDALRRTVEMVRQ